jgi:hypothetical protein
MADFINQVKPNNDSCCPTLDLKTRLWGFGICFCLGVLISFLSFFSFSQMLQGEPANFAIFYTLGNIIALLRYLL